MILPDGVTIGTSIIIFIFAGLMKIAELKNRSSPKNYCSEVYPQRPKMIIYEVGKSKSVSECKRKDVRELR